MTPFKKQENRQHQIYPIIEVSVHTGTYNAFPRTVLTTFIPSVLLLFLLKYDPRTLSHKRHGFPQLYPVRLFLVHMVVTELSSASPAFTP